MLFVYPNPGRLGFWMKDMQFSIDIIWFYNGEVVDMVQNVPYFDNNDNLPKYYPRSDANAVLELPAGWASEHDLKIGDILEVVDE